MKNLMCYKIAAGTLEGFYSCFYILNTEPVSKKIRLEATEISSISGRNLFIHHSKWWNSLAIYEIAWPSQGPELRPASRIFTGRIWPMRVVCRVGGSVVGRGETKEGYIEKGFILVRISDTRTLIMMMIRMRKLQHHFSNHTWTRVVFNISRQRIM